MTPLGFIGIAFVAVVVGSASALGLCWHLLDLALTDWRELVLVLGYAAAVLGL